METESSGVSQTPLWITLGVLYGAAYSLSADHYTRAQTNSHIFVRAAMLGLSCGVFLGSTASVAYICYKIRIQDINLDGLERVYSVLIPVVVRGDLLIDWGKRVVWLLFLAPSWTQSCVSLRRIFRRAPEFERLVAVDESVVGIARGEGVTEADFTGDCVAAENAVWADGAESLFKISQILDHMRKLAKVATYAVVGFVGAVPGAMGWVLYATYKGFEAWGDGYRRLAIAYWCSVLMAPLGAIVCMFVSAFAFVGIVSLSVVGAFVAFAVHWSTRMVYAMLRMGLTQAWADFPFVMRRDGAVASLKKNAEKLQTHVIELPGVMGKQVIELPALVRREIKELPGHFGSGTDRSRTSPQDRSEVPPPQYPATLPASQVRAGEGRVGDEIGTVEAAEEGLARPEDRARIVDGNASDVNRTRRATAPGAAERRVFRRKRVRKRTASFHDARGVADGLHDGSGAESGGYQSDSSSTDEEEGIGLYHGMVLERHPDEAGAAIARLGFLLPTELEFALASWDGHAVKRGNIHAFPTAPAGKSIQMSGGSTPVEGGEEDVENSPAQSISSVPIQPSLQPSLTQRGSRGERSKARRELRYMSRLGMDSQMNSAPKRRLTVYYCLGMIAQLQVSSGGNSWQIRRKLLRIPATTKLDEFISIIAAMDSIVACEAAEACIELGDRLHSTVHFRTIPASGRNVEVSTWLRALLLVLLADPLKPPSWMPSMDEHDSAFFDVQSDGSFTQPKVSKRASQPTLPTQTTSSAWDGGLQRYFSRL